jgi:hypothetical protein
MADTYARLLGLSDDTPLPDSGKTKHEHDVPVTTEKKAGLLANQQTSKEAKQQTSKEANKKPSPPVASTRHSQVDTSLLTTKEKTKYGTYLTDDVIAKIRIRAIQTNRDDHQVLQEAFNQYFERLEN